MCGRGVYRVLGWEADGQGGYGGEYDALPVPAELVAQGDRGLLPLPGVTCGHRAYHRALYEAGSAGRGGAICGVYGADHLRPGAQSEELVPLLRATFY